MSRLTAGNWNDTNAWIGADVPDATQDAYVSSAGAVTLDMNATVKSLVVSGGSSVDVTGFQLASTGDMTLVGGTLSVGAGGVASASNIRFDSGAISVGAGGEIVADAIHGDPATLNTAAGSTVEFNNFTRGASSATAATFNGNVTIGVGAKDDPPVTFNPDTITAWNVGQNLVVGNGQRQTTLVIDNGAWTVGGALDVQGDVIVDAGAFLGPGSFSGGSLDVTGPVTVDNSLTYRGSEASNTTYTIFGGSATKFIDPPNPTILKISPGSSMIFEDTTQGIKIGARATSTTINVVGGSGDGAPGGVVTFKGVSHADMPEFSTGAGIGGDSLRISNPVVIAGEGGRILFKDNSYASGGNISNYGGDAHGPHGSGGATIFSNDSRAFDVTFDNYGSTLQSSTGIVPAPGGRTTFTDDASAERSIFYNHPGQGMGSLGAGITVFSGKSNADPSISPTRSTYTNLGGVPGAHLAARPSFTAKLRRAGPSFSTSTPWA